MMLPRDVHTFPFEVEIVGQEMTLHPAAIETVRGLLLLDAGMPHKVGAIIDGIEWTTRSPRTNSTSPVT